MSLANGYLKQSEFASYEDFQKNFEILVPENFNFAYDVVDRLGTEKPDKLAMVWRNVAGDHRNFTFGEMRYYSDKAANVFQKYGVKKGDRAV